MTIQGRLSRIEQQMDAAEPGAQCPKCGGPAVVRIRWRVSGLPFAADCVSGGHGRQFLPGDEVEMAEVWARTAEWRGRNP
jgi:hypothetical protein